MINAMAIVHASIFVPVMFFVIKDGKSHPENMDDCVGCESCVEECAQGAITVEET